MRISVAFASVFSFIPWPEIWQSLYDRPLEDRRVYSEQIVKGHLAYDAADFDHLLSYISGEYLWGFFLNLLVRTLGFSIEVTFLLISFAIIFTASMLVLEYARPAYLVLLINPIFVDLAFSQMRSGLAIALATWAFLLSRSPRSKPLQLILIAVASAVHTSAALFIVTFVAAIGFARLSKKRTALEIYCFLLVLGCLAALALGPLRTGVLLALDDRRASAEYVSAGGKFYLIWLIVIAALSLDWSRVQISAIRAVALTALAAILLGVPLGSYSNRILALSLPFLLAAISSLSERIRPLVVLAYLGYLVLYWSYWLRLVS